MKVIYVAGRFSAPDQWQRARNVRAAETLAFAVAEIGAMPLNPLNNTHNFFGTLTEEFWYAGTMELLRRCDAVILVPGWQESKGVQAELAEAARLNLPVFTRVDEVKTWLAVNSAPVKIRTAQEVAEDALADENIYGCGDEPVSVGVQQRLVDAVTKAIELDRLTRLSHA